MTKDHARFTSLLAVRSHMSTALPDQDEVLNAIRSAAQTLGHPPSRSEFKSGKGEKRKRKRKR